MQKTASFNNVAVVSVKGSDSRIHFWYMSKDGPVNLLNDSVSNKVVSNKMLSNKGVL